MKIKKRDGKLEELRFDKIKYRLRKLKNDPVLGPLKNIDSDLIAQKVISSIYDGVLSSELDEEAGRIAVNMIENIEYPKLASRLCISNLHKNTTECFSEVVEIICEQTSNLFSDNFVEFVRTFKTELNDTIDYNRDYLFDYFGIKTLEKSYLVKINGKTIERPQHLYMRVAIAVSMKDGLNAVIETYNLISQHYLTFASPVLFNSGYKFGNLASCYLLGTGDSIEGIFKTISDCGRISKIGGGIGIHISNIRSKGSIIRGTNGVSDGIVPMLRVYNSVGVYVNQCLKPGNRIFTKNGMKTIKDITLEDQVITHDGGFQPVNDIYVNYKKGEFIFEIYHNNNCQPLEVTRDHEILVADNELEDPKYTMSQNIKIGSYLCYPIPRYSRPCKFNKDVFKMIGIIIQCGEFENGVCTVKLTDNCLIKVFNFCKSFSECEIRDLDIIYSKTDSEEWEFIKKMLGVKNLCKKYNKHNFLFHTDFVHYNKDLLAYFLVWMIKASNYYNISDSLYYDIQNQNIIGVIRYALLKNKILVEFIKRENRIFLSCYKKDLLVKIQIPFYNTNTVKNYDTVITDKYIYAKVQDVKISLYSGPVYDLGIEANHNYLTDSGLVHNSGKRKGAFAIYLSIDHPDIMDFLDLKKNQGAEELRTRDLFLAVWVSDLFMRAVEMDEDWYLFDPDNGDKCGMLNNTYGAEYETLYKELVDEKMYKKIVKARDVWTKILESQIETGVPYILYKDAVNKKSNQKNVGVIKSSNLCSEVLLYSDENEYAVCNLESIALPKYVENNAFNHNLLHDVVKKSVRQMNNIIDCNFYPVEEAKTSNLKHRPIGIGVQGLSDVYCLLRYPFESLEAKKLNKEIFETIYHAALEGSMELAKEQGPYSTFRGSPASEGKLQFDLWSEYSGTDLSEILSGRYDWDSLKRDIIQHGLFNSTLTALMPTASTAQIMGNTESFENFDSCIYKRRVLSGEFLVINKHLFKELTELGLWNSELKDMILSNNGSIQGIDVIPEEIKNIYKTIWEIPMKTYIEHSADRAPFIDMTQSLNLYMESPTTKRLNSMHFYAWKLGLKTGIYYLRTKTKAVSGKFSVNPDVEKKMKTKMKNKERVCNETDENGACLLCSS